MRNPERFEPGFGKESEEESLKEEMEDEEKEKIEEKELSELKVEKQEPLKIGKTKPILVELENHKKAIFKPYLHEGEKRDDFIKNDRLAYLVSEILGLKVVPITVIREINGITGSLQKFIEGGKNLNEIDVSKLPASLKEKLAEAQLFSAIICNKDTSEGNFILRDDKFFAIDNELSFESKGTDKFVPLPFLLKYNVSPETLQMLKEFVDSEDKKENFKKALSEFKDEETADLYIKRLEKLLECFDSSGKFSFEKASKLFKVSQTY